MGVRASAARLRRPSRDRPGWRPAWQGSAMRGLWRCCQLIGHEPVVADTMEASRQDVHQEAADELVGGERHHLEPIAPFGPIVFPLEAHTRCVECDQPSVGNGDTVGVARQIGQHRLGSTLSWRSWVSFEVPTAGRAGSQWPSYCHPSARRENRRTDLIATNPRIPDCATTPCKPAKAGRGK